MRDHRSDLERQFERLDADRGQARRHNEYMQKLSRVHAPRSGRRSATPDPDIEWTEEQVEFGRQVDSFIWRVLLKPLVLLVGGIFVAPIVVATVLRAKAAGMLTAAVATVAWIGLLAAGAYLGWSEYVSARNTSARVPGIYLVTSKFAGVRVGDTYAVFIEGQCLRVIGFEGGRATVALNSNKGVISASVRPSDIKWHASLSTDCLSRVRL